MVEFYLENQQNLKRLEGKRQHYCSTKLITHPIIKYRRHP